MTVIPVDHHLLTGYPVAIEIPVQWGELDAYGHVNNTVFFRYFESARMAYLDQCGFSDLYDSDRIGPILHSTECRFRYALYYPDTVLVGARTLQIERDRFVMGYAVVSQEQDKTAADGRGTLVSFDYKARTKVPLPESVRIAIEDLERA
jgi:acyl-CoA thioester hydrolase